MNSPWWVARVKSWEITPLSMLLSDGWEPFAADGPDLYLRIRQDERPAFPSSWPNCYLHGVR